MSLVNSRLLRADELIGEFEARGLQLVRTSKRVVRDGKSMVGMEFARSAAAL
jgi:hypothetical protein